VIKIEHGIFKCEYPGCPLEGDRYYLIVYQGKKIRVCEECYKKTRRPKSG